MATDRSFVVRSALAMGLAILVVGCTDQGDQPNSGEADGAHDVARFATLSHVPTCNPSRRASVYYVADEAAFYYCDGDSLRLIELTGEPGADGTSWLVATSAADSVCSDGGAYIFVGPDLDHDGVLDASEISSTTAVCNGAVGPAGPPGADGADGADGAPGSSCHVRDNGDGTKLLYCDDGTEVIIRDGDAAARCGDGHVDPTEECDDGASTATCDADCTLPSCGDDFVNAAAGEECEPGLSNGLCTASCVFVNQVVEVNPTSISVEEGTQTAIQVRLKQPPLASTIVTASSSLAAVSVTATLSFTPANYDSWQNALVFATADSDNVPATAVLTFSNLAAPSSAFVSVEVTDPTVIGTIGWREFIPTSRSYTSGQVLLFPIVVTEPTNVGGFGLTAAAPGGAFRMALYSASSGALGTFVAGSAERNVTSAGDQFIDLPQDMPLPAGTYWLAVNVLRANVSLYDAAGAVSLQVYSTTLSATAPWPSSMSNAMLLTASPPAIYATTWHNP